eukprot:tig00000157_g9718.t1
MDHGSVLVCCGAGGSTHLAKSTAIVGIGSRGQLELGDASDVSPSDHESRKESARGEKAPDGPAASKYKSLRRRPSSIAFLRAELGNIKTLQGEIRRVIDDLSHGASSSREASQLRRRRGGAGRRRGGQTLANFSAPGLLGEHLPPGIVPLSTAPPGPRVLRGHLAVSLSGLDAYVDRVRISKSGFVVVRPEVVVRRTAPGAENRTGTTIEFVPTEELSDPALKAFMEALPKDISSLPLSESSSAAGLRARAASLLPRTTVPGARVERSGEEAGRGAPLMNRLDFEAEGRDYAGRWRKLIGAPGAPPNETLHLLIGVATPKDELNAGLNELTVAIIIVSAVCGSAALVLGLLLIVEVRRVMRRFEQEIALVSFFSLDPAATGPAPPSRRPSARSSRSGSDSSGAPAPAAPPGGRHFRAGAAGLVGLGAVLAPAPAPAEPPDAEAAGPPEDHGSHAVHSPISELDRVGAALAKMRQAVLVSSSVSDALLVVGAGAGAGAGPPGRSAAPLVHMNAAARRMFYPPWAPPGEVGGELARRPPVLQYFAPRDWPALAAFLADPRAEGDTLELDAVARPAPLPHDPTAFSPPFGPGAAAAPRPSPFEIDISVGRAGHAFVAAGAVPRPPDPTPFAFGPAADAAAAAVGRVFPVEISVGRMAFEHQDLQVLVVRDATQRKAMERSVLQSELRARVRGAELHRVLDSAACPFIGVDRALLITSWNAACARLTGVPPAAAVGRPFLALVEAAERGAAEALLARVLAAGPPAAATTAGPGRTGRGHSEGAPALPSASPSPSYRAGGAGGGGPRVLRLLLGATARHDAEGRVVGAIVVGQDITEKRRPIEAEAVNETKNKFLAYAVHELRTPLDGIRGGGESALDAEQRDLLANLRLACEQMLLTVNDLLDLQKIDAGKMALESIEFDLRAAVEEVVEVVAPTAFGKGVEVASHVPPEAPARLLGDPHRLKQILANFASNGVKFTQRGHVVVSTRDTGVGIPREGLERIFKDYAQADQSITRMFGGTGMGLAIAKRLAELMGGAVGVASVPSRGSVFHLELTLPVAPGPTPPALPALGVETEAEAGRPAVLVLHRDAAVAEILCDYAAALGWRPLPGGGAGPAGDDEGPRVVLVDDGYDEGGEGEAGGEGGGPPALPAGAAVVRLVDPVPHARRRAARRASAGAGAGGGLELRKPVRLHRLAAALARTREALAGSARASPSGPAAAGPEPAAEEEREPPLAGAAAAGAAEGAAAGGRPAAAARQGPLEDGLGRAAAPAGLAVLVVDDVDMNRKVLLRARAVFPRQVCAALLRRAGLGPGLEVETAVHGAEAVAAVRRRRPRGAPPST